MSLPNSKSTRYYFRKGYARPCGRPRSAPALSTQEAAALVIGIIEARLHDGWPLDQIGWRKYCRDSAVVQVVAQHLEQDAPI
jgi:hypothetical protein